MYGIKYWEFLLLFLFCFCSVQGQDFTGYLQPKIALNYKVSPFYSQNYSVQNRSYFYRNEEASLAVRQIDAVHFSNYKLMDNQSIALGVQFRFREAFEAKANELRFTQQYDFTIKPFSLRYGHRFRTEQRITTNNFIHRFRYRFSLDLPLNGERLDLGETYLVGNWESLVSVGKKMNPEYDQRLTLQLGWFLSDTCKVQIGTEYRLEDALEGQHHILFFLSTLNISI
ncbi:DUF2490 domain-containing protein [Croceivirga sp. JEA036]|uniref:DUF2490 domain-containing protein n=1 Tax=Croceivirga sp. JEA036 TaxID=2721162 RepID=UPI00143C0F69|nr:DUF2490 domain-containing protein [Croceivirga sp. JEA036]NJB36805.1 DUF2490 domain-containing protein [Croceivirga sp. JEA036]